MGKKVLVDKDRLIGAANNIRMATQGSWYYYSRYTTKESLDILGNFGYSNPYGYGIPSSNQINTLLGYKNQWTSVSFPNASRVCFDVYWGISNSTAYGVIIAGDDNNGETVQTAYSSSSTLGDKILKKIVFSSNYRDDQDYMWMPEQSINSDKMNCFNAPHFQHYEFEGNTFMVGGYCSGMSGATLTTGGIRTYGCFVMAYDPDSVDDTIDPFTLDDFTIEKQLSKTKYKRVYKNNGLFNTNNGYIQVDVDSKFSTMNRVQITATSTTVSNKKRRTYDLSSYLTKNDQVFFLRLYVQGTSSSSGSSSGYVEFLFSPLFMDLNTGTSATTMPTTASGGYNMWMKKSSSSSTYSSSASPAVNTASVLWNVSSNPWSYCSWNWNPTSKVLYLENNSSSNYYPSSEKAVLYYVAS